MSGPCWTADFLLTLPFDTLKAAIEILVICVQVTRRQGADIYSIITGFFFYMIDLQYFLSEEAQVHAVGRNKATNQLLQVYEILF